MRQLVEALAKARRAPRRPFDQEAELARWRGRGHARVGLIGLAVLVVGLGGWSATAMIAGAVIASGRVKVDAERQVVQHPDGGVVAEILAWDGDRVRAGEPLIRLDDAELSAELALIESRYFETLARVSRLRAERDGAADLTLGPVLAAASAQSASVAELADGQRGLLAAQLETEARQIAQLAERQTQIRSEIEGIEAQRAAAEKERGLLLQELEAQRRLLARNLIERSRVLAGERALSAIDGRIGELTARVAVARGRIAELEIEQLRLVSERREGAIAQLRDALTEAAELAERRGAVKTRLGRLAVTSPRAGVVTESTVFALRAVVRPAEPILYVVPSDSELVIEAEVEDVSIDRLFLGQVGRVRMPAFNARTTPELNGAVTQISADAVEDERTGQVHYVVEIALSDAELSRLGDLQLTPGMPVDVFFATEERTALSYLIKPFTDYFVKAMREE